jgi:sugar fermentation stimulation protein A
MSFQKMARGAKGSYILLIKLPEEQKIATGRLKTVRFPPGFYAYVGSAMGGLEARINRHLRVDKKPHWHIDYLLQKASIYDILVIESQDRTECSIAKALSTVFDSITGFGSTDCRCRSHLFFAAREMKPKVMAVLDSLGERLKT